MSKVNSSIPSLDTEASPESTAALLRELVAHLRQNRTQLREEWVRRITESKLLTAMFFWGVFGSTWLVNLLLVTRSRR